MRLFVITSQYNLVSFGVHDFFSFVKSFAGVFWANCIPSPPASKNIMVYPDMCAQEIW